MLNCVVRVLLICRSCSSIYVVFFLKKAVIHLEKLTAYFFNPENQVQTHSRSFYQHLPEVEADEDVFYRSSLKFSPKTTENIFIIIIIIIIRFAYARKI